MSATDTLIRSALCGTALFALMRENAHSRSRFAASTAARPGIAP